MSGVSLASSFALVIVECCCSSGDSDSDSSLKHSFTLVHTHTLTAVLASLVVVGVVVAHDQRAHPARADHSAIGRLG